MGSWEWARRVLLSLPVNYIKITGLTFILFMIPISKVQAAEKTASDTYAVDAAHSSAKFSIRNFGITKVKGSFSDIAGEIVADKAIPSESSVEISIGTASINTGIKKRDADLRSSNFFDVEKYPTMSFKSTNVKETGDGRFDVIGDFTLHGVTKTITVTVFLTKEEDVPAGGHHIAFKSDFGISRSDFNITHDSGMIGDNASISLVIEAARK